ncbi:MAG: colanic acid/amylovoran biosynthesis glycosyltransferase, partial [Flavobacteriales bacterium]
CLRSKSVTLEHVYHLKFYEKFDRDDVFHVHFATAISPLLNLIRIGFLKSKVIVTFHGYDAYILPKGNKLERLIDDYRKYVHAITVNSQFLKNRLVSQGFDKVKIHVIPVGIDCSKFIQKGNSRALNENFKLLSIGRLIPLKGHRFGIEVAKKLIDRGHDIQYTIAGYGELLKPLEELIADYKLEGKVFLIGKQSQEKIAALLQASDIFLMTSTYNRVNRREAFGMVSLEAQVAGVPVVGFNSGGFPETVIEDVTGFIVDDRDVDAMVLAVEKLLLNNDLLESMRKNATQHIIDTFDINSVAEAYFGLYQ